MGDLFGRLVAIILVIVSLVYVPVLIIGLRYDATCQEMTENAVTEFIDKSRVTGRITSENYEALCRTLGKYCPVAHIEMTHRALGYEDGIAYGYTFNKDDITTYMYERYKDYELRNGDYLSVTVYNNGRTIGSSLYRLINPTVNGKMTVFVRYGGAVGNNKED